MEAIDRKTLLQIHNDICSNAQSLMKVKNHDYSGGKDASDPFLNFTRVEKLGITDTKTGFMVRITDKISRLVTFVQTGQFKVKDEALRDTVMDLINYSILLYAYTASNKDDYTE